MKEIDFKNYNFAHFFNKMVFKFMINYRLQMKKSKRTIAQYWHNSTIQEQGYTFFFFF